MKIEIKDLYKSFGDLKIYEGLNLTVESGECSVIMGGSGTGKSVLLKHILGLITPDSGQILVDGQDIAEFSERELTRHRKRFGMIFQNGGMLQSLNVAQNVGLPIFETKDCDREKTMELIGEKLALVGMEGREDQPVTTLSGGQRKRVAIARALVQEAECFLFDEPTAGLDPIMSGTVDDVIVETSRQTNATCIIVTHDLVNAFATGHCLHLLSNHNIVASGTPQEFRESKIEEVREFLDRSLCL